MYEIIRLLDIAEIRLIKMEQTDQLSECSEVQKEFIKRKLQNILHVLG